MATAAPTRDGELIRRAVDLADLNALRVALYQNTRDAALAALPVAAKMSDADKALLKDKAVRWLEENAGRAERPDLPEPPEGELRALMTMVTGQPMSDVQFAARRDLPAFRAMPLAA